MGQKLLQEKIGRLTQSGGVVTLASSVLDIGGQQYQTSALNLTLSGLSAATRYQIYAVQSAGVVSLVMSTNENSTGPSGYTSWKLVGSFNTDSSSSFAGFMDINGTVIKNIVKETIASPTVLTSSTYVTSISNLTLNGTMVDGTYVLQCVFAFNMATPGTTNFAYLDIDSSDFSFLNGKSITDIEGTFNTNVHSTTVGRHFVSGNFRRTGNNLQISFVGDFQAVSSRVAVGTLILKIDGETNQSPIKDL